MSHLVWAAALGRYQGCEGSRTRELCGVYSSWLVFTTRFWPLVRYFVARLRPSGIAKTIRRVLWLRRDSRRIYQGEYSVDASRWILVSLCTVRLTSLGSPSCSKACVCWPSILDFLGLFVSRLREILPRVLSTRLETCVHTGGSQAQDSR